MKKGNPYHDKMGRFASGPGGMSSRMKKVSKEQIRRNRSGTNETRALARTRLLESRKAEEMKRKSEGTPSLNWQDEWAGAKKLYEPSLGSRMKTVKERAPSLTQQIKDVKDAIKYYKTSGGGYEQTIKSETKLLEKLLDKKKRMNKYTIKKEKATITSGKLKGKSISGYNIYKGKKKIESLYPNAEMAQSDIASRLKKK